MTTSGVFVLRLSLTNHEKTEFTDHKASILSNLSSLGFSIPPSFVVTKAASETFFKENRIQTKIKHLLGTVNYDSVDSLSQVARHIQKIIKESEIPDEIVAQIFKEYKKMGINSPVLLDDEEIHGEAVLIDAIRGKWAHNYTPKSLFDMYSSGEEIITHKDILVQKKISGLTGVLRTSQSTKDQSLHVELSNGEAFDIRGDKEVVGTTRLSKKVLDGLITVGKEMERLLYFPHMIEFVLDDSTIFVTYTKPQADIEQVVKRDIASDSSKFIGDALVPGVGIGAVTYHKKNLSIAPNTVLVVSSFDKKIISEIKKAAALVLVDLPREYRSSIYELGIPSIIGSKFLADSLNEGMVVTVNGTTGEIKMGGAIHVMPEIELNLPQTVVKVLGDVGARTNTAGTTLDGAIIYGSKIIHGLKTHPKKLHNDGKEKDIISEITGTLKKTCTDLYPNPVFYQFSNLTSHDFKGLEHGHQYETTEHNPKLGFRGAARHIKDLKQFKTELTALKDIRTKEGLTNLRVILPFVRTTQELKVLLKLLHETGLLRSHTFKIYLSVDTPANVILIEELLDAGLDGAFINLDSLTELTLAVDKDNDEVSSIFDEKNKAVLWSLERVISAARGNNLYAGIYGTSLQDTELLDKLIRYGVQSICVPAPDVILMQKTVHTVEQKLIKHLTA